MTAEAGQASDAPQPPLLTRKTWVYHVGLSVCWVFVRLYHRGRIRGREHLPREGGYLLVSNHQSSMDIPLLGVAVWRHAAFVYRDTLRNSRFLAWFIDRCGGIPIRRGAADRAALRAMTEHLAAGDVVTVFPEGTRSTDGRVAPFRGGVLVAARKAGVPLVPASIRRGCSAWPRGRALPDPRCRISVVIGPPIDPAAPDALERLQAAIREGVGDGRFGGGPAPAQWRADAGDAAPSGPAAPLERAGER